MSATSPLRRPVGREGDVLAFYEQRIVERATGPSYREIAAHFGFSPSRAGELVKKLRARGLLVGEVGATRGNGIPGLIERLVAERLAARGSDHAALSDEQLPVLIEIKHIPDPAGGDDDCDHKPI